jgi:collagenase-like PrtC family protease
MAIFSVPADFRRESLLTYAEQNPGWDIPVGEVYGSLRSSHIGSGRRFDMLPDTDRETFGAYLRLCGQLGFEYNYTLNTNCLGNQDFTADGRRTMAAFMTELVEAGAARFTVALPTLIMLLEAAFPEIPVTVSVIAGVDTLSKAQFYSRFRNVKCIYLHEAMNRKPAQLREIARCLHDAGIQVGTLVNCSCLLECPQRQHHYNFESHANGCDAYVCSGFYGSICAVDKYDDPRMFLSAPWIRPDDMDFYREAGVDRFKVSGRELIAAGADLPRTVDVYNSRQWDGDLMDLFMCFAMNKYSEVLTLQNGPGVADYLAPILGNRTPCSKQGCALCGNCAKHGDLLQVDPAARQRWVEKFQARLSALQDVVTDLTRVVEERRG